MTNLGDVFTDDDTDDMIRLTDRDGDDIIDIMEFHSMFKKGLDDVFD